MKLSALYFYLLMALFLTLNNCSKDKDEENGDDEIGFNEACNPTSFPGLEIAIDGDISDDIDPMSDEFDDYLACVQNCAQADPNDPQCMMNCMSILGVVPAGAPFSLSVQVTNITTAEIVYVIQPGDCGSRQLELF